MTDSRAGPSDTAPEIDEMQIEGYRRMSVEEKIARVVDLNRTVEALAVAGIRRRHGEDIPERELRLRLAALRHPRELMIAALGWDPEVEGY